MGYRRIPTIHTLDSIPDEEGLVVRMSSIRLGKLRRLMQLTSDDSGDGGVGEILDLFQESLVSWNLEDEDGSPVPTTMEGIESQDFDLVMRVVESWMDRITGSDGKNDLGKDSTFGESFPGRPLTMEAL